MEISSCVLANSVPVIATASVFLFSGYCQWTLFFWIFFMGEHLVLSLDTVIGSTWRHQLYIFVFCRPKSRGIAAKKHDISVSIDDILCTCPTKRLCFSPKPFLLWFSQCIAYEFHTTLSEYDWMKPEISSCVSANSIWNIVKASVFMFSGYYQWTLLFWKFFIREHFIFSLDTLIGSSWEHQLYTFVFSREQARGTSANKHDISVCIDDSLCTCLT